MRICLPFLLVLYVFLMAMPAQLQYSMGQAGSQLLGREVSLAGRMAHGSHTKRPQNCRRGSKVNTAETNCKGLIKGTRPSTYQFPGRGQRSLYRRGRVRGFKLTSHALNPRTTIPIQPRFTGSEGPGGVIRRKGVVPNDIPPVLR